MNYARRQPAPRAQPARQPVLEVEELNTDRSEVDVFCTFADLRQQWPTRPPRHSKTRSLVSINVLYPPSFAPISQPVSPALSPCPSPPAFDLISPSSSFNDQSNPFPSNLSLATLDPPPPQKTRSKDFLASASADQGGAVLQMSRKQSRPTLSQKRVLPVPRMRQLREHEKQQQADDSTCTSEQQDDLRTFRKLIEAHPLLSPPREKQHHSLPVSPNRSLRTPEMFKKRSDSQCSQASRFTSLERNDSGNPRRPVIVKSKRIPKVFTQPVSVFKSPPTTPATSAITPAAALRYFSEEGRFTPTLTPASPLRPKQLSMWSDPKLRPLSSKYAGNPLRKTQRSFDSIRTQQRKPQGVGLGGGAGGMTGLGEEKTTLEPLRIRPEQLRRPAEVRRKNDKFLAAIMLNQNHIQRAYPWRRKKDPPPAPMETLELDSSGSSMRNQNVKLEPLTKPSFANYLETSKRLTSQASRTPEISVSGSLDTSQASSAAVAVGGEEGDQGAGAGGPRQRRWSEPIQKSSFYALKAKRDEEQRQEEQAQKMAQICEEEGEEEQQQQLQQRPLF